MSLHLLLHPVFRVLIGGLILAESSQPHLHRQMNAQKHTEGALRRRIIALFSGLAGKCIIHTRLTEQRRRYPHPPPLTPDGRV